MLLYDYEQRLDGINDKYVILQVKLTTMILK